MKIPTFVLLGAWILLCIHDTAAGCGGCSSSRTREAACEDSIAVTRSATRRVSRSSGWLFWRRRRYRTQYYTETTYQKTYTCCDEYSLEYRTCVRDCGISKYSNAGSRVRTLIVGGIEARENEFPWQIYLYIKLSDGSRYCGGTIISDQYILTAAHCVYGRPVSGMTVYAGQHTLLVAVQSQPVKDFFVSGYNRTGLINDIAILKLTTPLTLGDTARPACLPKQNEKFVGRSVIISGWGRTVSDDPRSRPGHLRYTKVKVAPTETCERFYIRKPHMLCLTDGRNDTDRSSCFGDSGGPTVVSENGRFVVIGLSSFVSGVKGCAGGRPFGYAGVSGYIPWIKRVTGL